MRRLCSSLVVKREAWCLTWRGWALLVTLSTFVFLMSVRYCGSFLTFNRPIPADVLIVEGWLPDYALKGAAEEFQRGRYRYIITAGSPLIGGYFNSEAKSSAHLAATALIRLGLATNLVVPVPGPAVLRERSLSHAKAVKDWIEEKDPSLRRVNVYSLGVHARRTCLLFERVLGNKIEVGSIAHVDAAYDLDRWWKTSQGFRTVTEEALGYMWARLIGWSVEQGSRDGRQRRN